MTNITELAKQAGWSGIYSQWVSPIEREHLTVPVTMDQIQRFHDLAIAAYRESLLAGSDPAAWKEAVINELIISCILNKEHETNPRKAVQDAISWNCQIVLDPLVSSDAQALVDRGASEYRQRLLEGVGEPVGEAYLCDACDTPFDGGYYCPSKTCGHNTSTKQPVYTADQLAAAVAREREECAKVCEQWGAWNNVAQDCAAAIRARK